MSGEVQELQFYYLAIWISPDSLFPISVLLLLWYALLFMQHGDKEVTKEAWKSFRVTRKAIISFSGHTEVGGRHN